MQALLLWKNSRAAALELSDGSVFEAETPWKITVNGEFYKEETRTVTFLYSLEPETDYIVRVERGEEYAEIKFMTDSEEFTLNVKDFGARGDGISDDTACIQAAVMACPRGSRVLIPEGIYRVSSIFLKDDLMMELAKGAELSAFTERERFPVFKGTCVNEKNGREMILGTWEGDPMDMFTAVITGVQVRNVTLYGEGTVNGNAGFDNWWDRPKEIRMAARPRMIFLNRCENVVICGITVKNSPSWNIHPYFSDHLRFIGIHILGPKDSPNTDGLNPESCMDVEITGCCFSVGDDCIAIKSGKIAVGVKYKKPSSDIRIRQCCMRDGHGSITLGSEMAGGVLGLQAKQCRFINTDRGLRIKTRRGRGKDAVIDRILFEDIEMDHVMTPFVINCFYFCDADGHSSYVQCKEALPVDERTPAVKSLTFRRIQADNCHVAAAFFYGLPEKKIESVEMEHIRVTYAENARSGQPAMMDGIDEKITRMGIFAKNIKKLTLNDINITGQAGEPVLVESIDELEK